MSEKVFLKEGAEARLYQATFLGKNVLMKERIQKNYRRMELDEKIRKERTKLEANVLVKARQIGVRTPLIYGIQKKASTLMMEWLGKETLKQALMNQKNSKQQKLNWLKELAEMMAKLHANGLVHGDLTTSNVMVQKKSLGLIDFGLSKFSSSIEDQATDLVGFERTFAATHSTFLDGFQAFLTHYQQYSKHGKAVFTRMQKIKARARYWG